MHKKIVNAISDAITKKMRKDIIKIFIDDKQTGGFWRMIIIVHPDYKYLISHIEDIGMSIGRYYGESLWNDVWNNTIIFS